jgi:hypothetical protein
LRPYWTITGQITILDKNGDKVHHPEKFQNIRIRTQPVTTSFQDPVFEMTIPGHNKGDLPTIMIDIPNYGPPQILDVASLPATNRDEFYKTIKMDKPIVLREMPRNVSNDARPQ